VLQETLKGKTADQIATESNLSSKTIETHIMRIKCKLDCTKQREIISLMIQHDIAKSILDF
jgi:DNA-binding NarL/FixJ family response regulator